MTSLTSAPISVLLIDDHVVVRSGLRMLIESEPGLKVVGEAGDRAEGLAVAAREQPDVIILDIDLGGDNGLDFLPELVSAASGSRILVLTGVPDPRQHRRALSMGVMGLVLKDKAAGILINAIKKVHGGEVWLDQATMVSALAKTPPVSEAGKGDPEAEKIATLTRREREVLGLVAQGLTNQQIAEQLFISLATARHHVEALYSKLGLSSRLQLILYAYKHGLASPPP
ncbi:MAG TPA: response regulator transcription factor [Blastocatellia bacterium]|nr:response regulator transcription factor [Blastocatellia bacterium]